MELPQIISIIAVSTLTIISAIVGVQLILILKELKTSLIRFNQVMDSAEIVIKKFSQPLTGMIGLVEGIRQSSKIIEIITSILNRQSSKKYNEFDNEPI
jgi:hypothetical protein